MTVVGVEDSSLQVDLWLMVWHSGSTLVSINKGNLRRARLVLGWVTMSGFSSQCKTDISVCNQPPGQLGLSSFRGR